MIDLLPNRPQIGRSDVPDALFETDNVFGIPLLDSRLQADYCHLPVRTWGSVKRNQTMPGTWHFYTQDYRFEALWSDPSPVVNSQCICAVEPNFTTSEQMATAVALYQIYRKRWLARYWQKHGVRVWVDLNVAPEMYALNLFGVPQGWKAYMTRGYSEHLGSIEEEYVLACGHRGGDDVLFAVYGGGMGVRDHCLERGFLHIPETMDIAKGKFAHG